MRIVTWKTCGLLVAAGLFALTIGGRARAQEEAIGIVRISDGHVASASHAGGPDAALAQPCGYESGAGNSGPVLELSGNPVTDWYRVHRFEKNLANECGGDACPHCHGSGCPNCHRSGIFGRHHGGACDCDDCRHGRCRKFGCLTPDGGCGTGVPCMRHYQMTYAVDPWYFDRRDGRVYAAQGFGAPMSVPTAPNVTNNYNYGWGIPSSRLTPISRVAPQPGAMQGAMAPR